MKALLVLTVVVFNACGDLLSAYGMRRQGEIRNFRPGALREFVAAVAHNGYVIGGVAAMAVSFFALLVLLSIANLSFAVPATSAGYLLETILAKVALKEDVRWERWLGALLVGLGVALVSLN